MEDDPNKKYISRIIVPDIPDDMKLNTNDVGTIGGWVVGEDEEGEEDYAK